MRERKSVIHKVYKGKVTVSPVRRRIYSHNVLKTCDLRNDRVRCQVTIHPVLTKNGE